jgi:predicted TIM-barrel fold metal-dependent hydrolase
VLIDALSCAVPSPAGYGGARAALVRMRGYMEHFGGGTPPEMDGPDMQARMQAAYEVGATRSPTEEELIAMLTEAGAALAVVHSEQYRSAIGVQTPTSAEVAEVVGRHSDRLIGVTGVDPWAQSPRAAVAEARELGLKGVVLSPFKQRLLPSDLHLAQLFAACEQEGMPLLLHSGINWWVDVPYDFGHPKFIDTVAGSFPGLKIVALHCAWPWVMDMMMVAWRHPNVYVDTSAHRPKHFLVNAAGWEPLTYYGNRMLRDKVMFGSSWNLIGAPLKDLIGEVRELPLSDKSAEAWLGGNAQRFYGL